MITGNLQLLYFTCQVLYQLNMAYLLYNYYLKLFSLQVKKCVATVFL